MGPAGAGDCGGSDAVDGLLARTLHQKSALGAYLDPIADKLLLVIVLYRFGDGKRNCRGGSQLWFLAATC